MTEKQAQKQQDRVKRESTLKMFLGLKYYCRSSRKCTLFSCYKFRLSERRRWVWVNEVHFRHLGKDCSRTKPVTSDVSTVIKWRLLILHKLCASIVVRRFLMPLAIFKISAFWKNNLDENKRYTNTCSFDTSDATARAQCKSFPRWQKWDSFCLNWTSLFGQKKHNK